MKNKVTLYSKNYFSRNILKKVVDLKCNPITYKRTRELTQ